MPNEPTAHHHHHHHPRYSLPQDVAAEIWLCVMEAMATDEWLPASVVDLVASF